MPQSSAARATHPLTCPRCAGPLAEQAWEAATVDVCRRCQGVWLDRGELERIVAAEREVDAANDSDHQVYDDTDDITGEHAPVGNQRGRSRRDRGDDDEGGQGFFGRLMNIFD